MIPDSFSELILFVACIIALIGQFIYTFRHKNHRWLVYLQSFSILGITTYYILLLFNVEPLTSSVEVRSQFVRFFVFTLLLSLGLDRINGRLARFVFGCNGHK